MKLWKKLTSRRGETLTETLVGVLIVGLASVVLVGMISAASHMNATAIAKDKALYEAVTAAEGRRALSGEEIATNTVTITLKVRDKSYNFDDPRFGDDTVSIYSYYHNKRGG